MHSCRLREQSMPYLVEEHSQETCNVGDAARAISRSYDELFSVAVDHHVSVVGNDDDLAIFLRLSDRDNEFVHNELVIEMVIVRIDDDRLVALREVDLYKHSRFLAEGEFGE